MKRALPLAVVFIALGAVGGSAPVAGMRAAGEAAITRPVWTETRWPFGLDQWGRGRAFVCLPADCGRRIDIYVRTKIGFCNCSTGVSDDAELERIGDAALVSAAAQGGRPGRPARVGWMHGRSRIYRAPELGARDAVLSVAYNDECDVVVALATLGSGDAASAEPAVLAFLNSDDMVRWAKRELGLEYVRREW
jgi:hypothetical protein